MDWKNNVLMLGLYQPDAGVILLDGIPLKDYASEDLRKKTSVVFQDFAKFYLSIRDNIALGDLSKDQNDWIESAAQKAQVDDFANELPQGYDTLLGKHFDGSHNELMAAEGDYAVLFRTQAENYADGIFA